MPSLNGLLTMPDVTDEVRVNGEPNAITNSPVLTPSESPSLAAFKFF
jgi:hypothetical protein